MSSFPRYPRYKFNWRGFLPPGIKTLVIACTAVFVVQTLIHMFDPRAEIWVNQWFGLVPRAVTHGLRLWQPFTYIFMHGSILHLLLNMLFLWMFGADLERTWGTKKFYSYFLTCGVGAGIINVIVKTILDPHGTGTAAFPPTIGASGAIFGVLLAAAVVFPDRQVWLIPFPVSLPMRVYVLIMGALEFYFGITSGSGDNVSHICHLGGMLVGYIYIRRNSLFYDVRNRYSDWQRKRLRRKFDVYVRKNQEKPPSRPDNWVN